MMNPTYTSAIISVPVTRKDAASPPPNSSMDVTMLSARKGYPSSVPFRME